MRRKTRIYGSVVAKAIGTSASRRRSLIVTVFSCKLTFAVQVAISTVSADGVDLAIGTVCQKFWHREHYCTLGMSGSIVCGLRSQHTVAGILLFSEATTAIVDGTLLQLTVLSAAVMIRYVFSLLS